MYCIVFLLYILLSAQFNNTTESSLNKPTKKVLSNQAEKAVSNQAEKAVKQSGSPPKACAPSSSQEPPLGMASLVSYCYTSPLSLTMQVHHRPASRGVRNEPEACRGGRVWQLACWEPGVHLLPYHLYCILAFADMHAAMCGKA